MKCIFKIFLFVIFTNSILFGQFGKNKVQYKGFTWYYVQTKHFDIYFSQKGKEIAEFTTKAAEQALTSLQNSYNYKINNRISIIVYNSTNDFQETNTTDQYLSEGIQGFTELFKNRVVIQFMGSYKDFRHLIHHELSHAVLNDMFYGGSIQNIIANRISIVLPLWFNEGMAEYQALGWDIKTDMFIRDIVISENLPDIMRLNGFLAYRGGQSVFYYISKKYGKEKIGELINKVKGTGSVEAGFKAALGLSIKELNKRWKKHIKKTYWPDISFRIDPEDFSKRLTDPENDDGFYNIIPSISPQGDKIAFISNRDFYFDLFIMSAIDGHIIKKLIHGNTTADFEQLNVITPGVTWSPDEKKIAMTAKSAGFDVIYLIDVESGDKITLPIELDGISSVAWSPDGFRIAFIGHNGKQSDVYTYNLSTKRLRNLTNDVFTDKNPSWSPDSKNILFVSDRNGKLKIGPMPKDFKIYNYKYNKDDIYSIKINSLKIERITDTPNASESYPLTGPDGEEILFVSDANGITNIYKKRIVLTKDDSIKAVADITPIPITNSLNGISQISMSKDGQKLTFSSLAQSSYNIYLMNNPFIPKTKIKKLKPTIYVASLKERKTIKVEKLSETKKVDSKKTIKIDFFTGQYSDTTNTISDSIDISYNNFVFGPKSDEEKIKMEKAKNEFKPVDNLDENGDYKVRKYKITFSPDLIYANAGYSTLYGLTGTTILSFSDVLGNHRLIGQTSLQFDLKNSDYGLSYFYLANRINYGVQLFHTARFVFLAQGQTTDFFRFRNFGAVFSASYPINKFYRVDAGLSFFGVSKENLDNPSVPISKSTFIIPTISLVKDNVLWGITAPIDGSRYRLDLFGNPGISDSRLSFYSVTGDYRTYFKMGVGYYSFAVRLAGGYSGGANPQRFFLGGTENWINRKFATQEVPIETTSDFVFLTAGVPLRGFQYAERIGSKYTMLNLELRFPLIRYLLTGGLPLFFSNMQGAIFIDAAATWNKTSSLKLFTKDKNGNTVTQDLLIGTGVGARVFFLNFLLRYDVGWAYNLDGFSTPIHYISLGADF
ncbi:MAG: PD40 domain-containing protein [Bacteroidetes bacterium]|nr:PD40 domain-containing protein [Bacteroidota bacterium]